MCFAAIAFIGSQGGGFDVAAIGKAYFAGNTAVGSASNGRHPSFTSDDFDLAVIEKITKVGSESIGHLSELHSHAMAKASDSGSKSREAIMKMYADILESMMEVHHRRIVRPR